MSLQDYPFVQQINCGMYMWCHTLYQRHSCQEFVPFSYYYCFCLFFFLYFLVRNGNSSTFKDITHLCVYLITIIAFSMYSVMNFRHALCTVVADKYKKKNFFSLFFSLSYYYTFTFLLNHFHFLSSLLCLLEK